MTKPWSEITHKSDTAYVGGPMTNLPNFNFDAFDSLSAFLRDVQGWTVHNPHEHDQQMYPGIDAAEATAIGDVVGIAAEVGFSFKDAMSWDLARVAESRHMVLLPGWESSTGAKAERFVAEMTGSQIWLANKSEHRPLGDPAWYITLDPEQKRLTPPSLPGVDLGYASAGKKPLKLYDGPLAEPVEVEIRNGQGIEQFARDGARREAWVADIEHVRQGSPFTMPHADPLGIQAGSGSQVKIIDPLQWPSRWFPDMSKVQMGVVHSAAELTPYEVRVTDADTGAEKGQKLARFDLLPAGPLNQLAEHYGRGSRKYADRNWEKGYAWSLSFGAMMRHAWAFWSGEDIDADTGSPHLIAVAWHALALVEFGRTHPEKDDRPLCPKDTVCEND